MILKSLTGGVAALLLATSPALAMAPLCRDAMIAFNLTNQASAAADTQVGLANNEARKDDQEGRCHYLRQASDSADVMETEIAAVRDAIVADPNLTDDQRAEQLQWQADGAASIASRVNDIRETWNEQCDDGE
ncbi:MAG: hypothetical protein JWP35_3635 [Caulobacter sp.]|nr:hypothetical protein [Caulobacter sp.]